MSTKKEILDYVMDSPENTNRAVLDSLLSDLEGGSSGVSSNILVIPIEYDETANKHTTTVTCGELKAIFNSHGAVMFTTTRVDKTAGALIVEVLTHDSGRIVYPSITGGEYLGTLLVITNDRIPAFYYARNFIMGEDNIPQPLNDSDPLYIGMTVG